MVLNQEALQPATSQTGFKLICLHNRWLAHFIEFVKATKDGNVALLFDSLTTHKRNTDVTNLARENEVSLGCLPLDSSNRKQTLDRTFMKTFKTYYAQEIENWLLLHPYRTITIYQVGKLIDKAYVRRASMNRAMQGFKVTGILPFNLQINSEADCFQKQPKELETSQQSPTTTD